MRLFNWTWFCLLPAVILLGPTASFAAPVVTTRLPLVFEPNRGQAAAGTAYILRGGRLQGEFQKNGVRLRLSGSGNDVSQVDMRLVGARKEASITGVGTLAGHTNYLVGNDATHWLRGLPNYAQVRYSQIYSGTDLLFYGNGDSLEHDFEVQPGADPKRIAFQLDGAESVSLDRKGDLQIKLPGGTIAFERPTAYQIVAGTRRMVDAGFVVGHDRTVRFRLGAYDATKKLVIDPVLLFSTYLSPLALNASLIATDASGSSYVAGYSILGFPVTSGAFPGCATCAANKVVTFVSKLSADGTNLLYSTLLGGNDFAQPTGIAVDENGNLLLSGWTGATDFPTKNGQPVAPSDNGTLGFLVSLSADGSSLNYGTMLGTAPSGPAAPSTYAAAVAVDSSGNAYVTGYTGDGFNITAGALNEAVVSDSRNGFDVFLAKFSPTGGLIYSAVLGTADPQNPGGGPIGPSAIAVDSAGDAFVAGQAGTLWPISDNAYLKQIAGPMPYATPFVTKVAADAKSLIYSTYLDYAYQLTGIAVLPTGDVFVTGNGVDASYPTTAHAYAQNSGGGAALLTELTADGSGLAYSTIIGDSHYFIHGLALDPDGDLWLAAQTSNEQFPLVKPIQANFPAPSSFETASVVNEFDPTGQTLKFSTFLGGSAAGYASSIAVDTNRKVHVSGAAEFGMYTSPGVYAGSVPNPGPGSEEAYVYVALIDPATPGATLCVGSAAGLYFGYLLPQTTASQAVQVSNCGETPLIFRSIASSNAAYSVPASSNTCTGSLAVGASCMVSVQFAPTAAQDYPGQLTFTSNASMAATSISLYGSGGEPVAGFGPPYVTQDLMFSSLLAGQTSQVESLSLYNNGTVPLTVYLSKIAVSNGFVLAPGGTCASSLAVGQSCLIAVQFAPATAGTFNGTLSVASNDPVNPTITTSLTGTAYTSYPVPTITELQSPSYPINSGTTPITMIVSGTNFFPVSVVYLNGAAQSTSYQSDTTLTVTFSPSLVNAVGQIPITVVNPAPGGGTSASYPLTGYLSIPLTTSALTVDPVGGLLYAAIPATAANNPNTVIPINPSTGATMAPIAVASGPAVLAVSDDGSELYVASTGVLQRINLKTLAVEKTFNLPMDSEGRQTYVKEMHVVPGSAKSIVVELFVNVDPAEDGAALYNDSGLINWLPGVSVTPSPLEIDSFTFTSPSFIYALPMSGTFFTSVQVSPTSLSGSGGGNEFDEVSGSIVRSDGTRLYTNSGQVWDSSTQKLLGTYLGSNGSPLFYAASVVPDTANGHTYFLDGEASLNIDVYDQASYALLGTVPFSGIIYSPDAVDLVRWGSKGFAFRTVDISGADGTVNQIVIVTSGLVTAGALTPVPILASVSPTTVYAGGPGYSMQLVGSGFTSASTVLVNGSSRATTYVSGTSLTAQVLATDIATNGQLSAQVSTPAPGGGVSNSVTVSIEPPVQATPTVMLTPSASTITTAQALTVMVAVSGGSGSGVATGSVALTGGGFASAAVPLSGGAATINIPAGSLAAGMDALTVAYTPDGAGSAIYQGATGVTTVTVAAVATSASTVTVTAASTAITNQQSDAVAITIAGVMGQPAPTGTVTLSSGSYRAQQTVAGGAASITVPAGALSSGANTLTAAYSGDGTYAGSSATTSVNVSQVVISTPAPVGVSPGGTATTSVTLSAGSNYSGTVSMSCKLVSSPMGAQSLPTCSLSPTTVTISTGGTGSTMLTVKTTASSTAALDVIGLGGGTILAGMLLIGVPAGRRRLAMLVLLGMVVAAGTFGCGGGGSGSSGSGGSTIPATTAGTYQFSVTGVDSAQPTITSSTNVAVTVQ